MSTNKFALATTVSTDDHDLMLSAEEMAEETDGLSMVYPRVKIPSGGMTQFEIPNPDDPSKPNYSPELNGVIVFHHPANGYWLEGDVNPVCSSVDGKTGVGDPGGNCSTCPLNQFGSGEGGVGKACKNSHVLYLLQSGSTLPIRLNLPPTAIRPFSNFVSLAFLSQGKRTSSAVIKITLVKQQSKNNQSITYSAPVFTVAERFTAEMERAVLSVVKNIKATIQSSQKNVTEYIAETVPADDEDSPF